MEVILACESFTTYGTRIIWLLDSMTRDEVLEHLLPLSTPVSASRVQTVDRLVMRPKMLCSPGVTAIPFGAFLPVAKEYSIFHTFVFSHTNDGIFSVSLNIAVLCSRDASTGCVSGRRIVIGG